MGLLSDIRAAFPDIAGPIVTEGGTADVDQASLKGDLELVRKAVRSIPNTSEHFSTRESYRDFLYAVKAALVDHPTEALELAQEWCERWQDGSNDPEVVEADWRRMRPPFRRGAGHLFKLASELSGGAFDRAEQWFEEREVYDPIFPVEESAGPETVLPPLVAGKVRPDELAGIKPRQWLYGFKISRRYVTFIASPGGVGKTAYTMAIGLAMASGLPLLHDHVRVPFNVWFFNLEDDREELLRRMAANLAFHGLDHSVLDRVHINSGRDRRFQILKLGPNGEFITLPDKQALVAELIRTNTSAFFADPVLRTHGLPENSNEAQDEVMRIFAEIAQEANCAIILVHHTKKGAVAGEMDSLRGGSTQGGGARAVLTLAPMSAEEAARLGIPEAQRRLYVRVDDAKNNMAPPVQKAEWIKLESVHLGNGDAEYPQGDNVQAAAKWLPPDAWEGMTGQVGDDALARIEAGLPNGERYSLRMQDKERWAGVLLVEQFERTPVQAKELLDTWLKQNVIEVRDYRSETQRKMRKGVYVNAKAPAPTGSVFD